MKAVKLESSQPYINMNTNSNDNRKNLHQVPDKHKKVSDMSDTEWLNEFERLEKLDKFFSIWKIKNVFKKKKKQPKMIFLKREINNSRSMSMTSENKNNIKIRAFDEEPNIDGVDMDQILINEKYEVPMFEEIENRNYRDNCDCENVEYGVCLDCDKEYISSEAVRSKKWRAPRPFNLPSKNKKKIIVTNDDINDYLTSKNSEIWKKCAGVKDQKIPDEEEIDEMEKYFFRLKFEEYEKENQRNKKKKEVQYWRKKLDDKQAEIQKYKEIQQKENFEKGKIQMKLNKKKEYKKRNKSWRGQTSARRYRPMRPVVAIPTHYKNGKRIYDNVFSKLAIKHQKTLKIKEEERIKNKPTFLFKKKELTPLQILIKEQRKYIFDKKAKIIEEANKQEKQRKDSIISDMMPEIDENEEEEQYINSSIQKALSKSVEIDVDEIIDEIKIEKKKSKCIWKKVEQKNEKNKKILQSQKIKEQIFGINNNINKKNTKICKFGTKCTRKDCHFVHSSDHLKNTKMCRFGVKCKRKDCHFAHKIEELRPVQCAYKNRCRFVKSTISGKYINIGNKKICCYIHYGETSESFNNRLGIKKIVKDPVKIILKNTTKNTSTTTTSKKGWDETKKQEKNNLIDIMNNEKKSNNVKKAKENTMFFSKKKMGGKSSSQVWIQNKKIQKNRTKNPSNINWNKRQIQQQQQQQQQIQQQKQQHIQQHIQQQKQQHIQQQKQHRHWEMQQKQWHMQQQKQWEMQQWEMQQQRHWHMQQQRQWHMQQQRQWEMHQKHLEQQKMINEGWTIVKRKK